jgi:hypothetical protein
MGFNRSGFNRTKFNSTAFSSGIGYLSPSAKTTTEGTAAAETTPGIDVYITGVSITQTRGFALLGLLRSLTMEYSGPLAAGEKVCINAENFTVTLDGANAIDKFDGDFPEVFPVDCTITYADDETSRTVKVIVSRRDRQI